MRLCFGDRRRPVVVDVDGDVLGASVSGLLAPLLLGDGAVAAGDDVVADLEVVRRGADITVRDAGTPGEVRRFRNTSRAMALIEGRMVALLLERETDGTPLHAAGWSTPGGVVLALGPSGAGKSSLALAASLRGWPVLADDCLFLRADGAVRGVPRLLKVHARQLEVHGLRREDTVAPHPREVEHWWDPARSGGWFRGWASPRVVARVVMQTGLRQARTVPLRPEEGLRVLLDGVMRKGARSSEELDRLLVVARSALCVDLRFGAVDDGLDALMALLEGGAR